MHHRFFYDWEHRKDALGKTHHGPAPDCRQESNLFNIQNLFNFVPLFVKNRSKYPKYM